MEKNKQDGGLYFIIVPKVNVSELNDLQQKYYEILNRSKNDLEQNKDLLTLTIEELQVYSNGKRA